MKKEIINLTHALHVLSHGYMFKDAGTIKSEKIDQQEWFPREAKRDADNEGCYLVPMHRLYVTQLPYSPERVDYVVEGKSLSRTMYLRSDGQWDPDIDLSLRLDTHSEAERIVKIMKPNTPFAELSVGTTTNSPQGFAYND